MNQSRIVNLSRNCDRTVFLFRWIDQFQSRNSTSFQSSLTIHNQYYYVPFISCIQLGLTCTCWLCKYIARTVMEGVTLEPTPRSHHAWAWATRDSQRRRPIWYPKLEVIMKATTVAVHFRVAQTAALGSNVTSTRASDQKCKPTRHGDSPITHCNLNPRTAASQIENDQERPPTNFICN